MVQLRLPPRSEFSFVPGQYVDMIGPNGIRRSYSLASGLSDGLLELHIRAVEDGAMSEYWFQQARVNDLLYLNGPLGTFFLRDVCNVDLVFLATGTGIAPVKAILESLAIVPIGRRPRTVTVLWGGRVLSDLYFNVSSIPSDFNYVPVLSRADAVWTGARGYVQEHLLTMFPDLSKVVVYACGSVCMIRSAKKMLTNNGLPGSRFYSDAFVCSSNR
jgi:CDP-4-dehydro-6-deoxyglucose reductase